MMRPGGYCCCAHNGMFSPVGMRHDFRNPTPPTLLSLDTKPSWHNRAGRVDRSACFTLTASQLWRQVPDDDWAYRLGLRPGPAGTRQNRPQDACPKPHHFGKCDRYATFTLYARSLWLMHKWENPYPLRGDFRSIKSNAMRAHIPRNKSSQLIQGTRNDSILGDGPINPNRGVGFNDHKMLGLDCMWQTTLRIERYVQHAKLKQHFLVCPVCSRKNNPNTQHLKPKPHARLSGRCTKLYLPLCTEQEYEDAQIAERWLRTHCHPNRPWSDAAVRLIERYSELFMGQHGRQLRCRRCLGLRYGEVKRVGDRMAGRGSRRAAIHISRAVRQEPPPPERCKLSEQSLFLTNLPKLLAKPVASTPLPTAEDTGAGSAEGRAADTSSQAHGSADPSPRPDPKGRGGKTIDALSAVDKEKLYLLLAGKLPAFQKRKQLIQTEREA